MPGAATRRLNAVRSQICAAAADDRDTAARRLAADARTPLTEHARLFVDFEDVSAQRNITREFHSAEKHGTTPVLTQDMPWERVGGMTASVVFDEEEQLFKCWYMAGGYAPGGDPSLPPGAPGHNHALHVLCLGTSVDGITWERPVVGLHSALGSLENNIVIGGDHHHGMDHFETVLKDPTDPDPARRYKAIGWSSDDWDGPLSGICGCSSNGLFITLSSDADRCCQQTPRRRPTARCGRTRQSRSGATTPGPARTTSGPSVMRRH